ncbi:MAG: transcription termination factor Rho [Clostridia bacterium]|nr:transcription termination factor Rho [Clostridia bacterium]
MQRFILFSENVLLEKHLSVVREIGRQIGVKAPASKKKEQIIKEIIAIQNGKIEPVKNNNKGAPTKISVDVSEFYQTENTPFGEIFPKPQDKLIISDVERAPFVVEGVLELHIAGYGFLRVCNYENSKEDIYVSQANVKKYNLRRGDKVRGVAKGVRDNDLPALQEVSQINGLDPELYSKRKYFDNLVSYYPNQKLKLEIEGENSPLSLRLLDLFVPLGKGQRGLIVAPPKTGKTTLLKLIAQAIEKNHKDVELIILLIDERPEEVTDIKRSVKGEVVYSTFDESPEHHIKAAELVINRAKRLVEVGKDVVILMDSITRLARAYNNTVESSGKTLSGGLDPNAMTGPKRFFGAARNTEDGGSLTILSTALVDTGSRMDDIIFEEFKGTGNMEIRLSRSLSERRVFPAIDINKSGTRKEDLLLNEEEIECAYKLRGMLATRIDATEMLIEMLRKSKNNKDLIDKADAWLKLYNK